jgi:malonyl-CoA/methylmalonyl-CoA synthetase
VHRILGRSSVDIIKTGGEKVSALEIEDVLANHSAVAEVAVVGIPDDEWGERVVAAVVPREPIETESLREWCRGYLATYKVPKQIAVMDALPRNALGKVVKNSVVAMITGDERE